MGNRVVKGVVFAALTLAVSACSSSNTPPAGAAAGRVYFVSPTNRSGRA
jgi:hypothetical protein